MNNSEQVNKIVSDLMDGTTALSFSALKNFRDSPMDFINYKLKTVEPTDAMLFGTMVHCLVLEPDAFETRFMAIDDTEMCATIGGAKPRATNKYKDWMNEQRALAGERVVVAPEDYKHAKVIALNVLYNRASAKVLKLTEHRETKIEWNNKNFNFRGIIDAHGPKCIMDLKTCADAETRKFQRDIITNGYYLQAAMYMHGLGVDVPYYIVAVDKMGGVSVHVLDEQLMAEGAKEYEFLLDKFNECILTDGFHKSYDFWAPRFDGIHVAEKPGWMYKQ